MSKELREALQRLESRPTTEVVAEAQRLAVKAASNFSTKEEVEIAAAILAQVTLGEGKFSGISCPLPRSCAESSLIYGWMQAERGDRFHIPPEIRADLADKMVSWGEITSPCTCVVARKVRVSRHEAAKAAKEAERVAVYEDYMSTFGHSCMSVQES